MKIAKAIRAAVSVFVGLSLAWVLVGSNRSPADIHSGEEAFRRWETQYSMGGGVMIGYSSSACIPGQRFGNALSAYRNNPRPESVEIPQSYPVSNAGRCLTIAEYSIKAHWALQEAAQHDWRECRDWAKNNYTVYNGELMYLHGHDPERPDIPRRITPFRIIDTIIDGVANRMVQRICGREPY